MLEPSDVAEDEDTPRQSPCFAPQWSATDADVSMNAFRHFLIVHHYLEIVRRLAVQGLLQRTFIFRDERLPIGSKNAVLLGPFIDVLLRRKPLAEPPRDRIVKYEFPIFIDGDHAFAHAVEYGFHQPGEIFQFFDNSFQSHLRLFVLGFSLVHRDGGLNVQMQLALLKRLQHVAKRVGRLRPLQQVFLAPIGQVHHGNVEPTADLFGCF